MATQPRLGFVVAMRARVTTAKDTPWYEWLIVSRWGPVGQHLLVGRTHLAAQPGQAAPIHLVPRRTALAELLRLPPAAGPPVFLFAQRQPAAVSVAGGFAPAEGYVRLHGSGVGLRLRAEGRCGAGATRPAWRVEAVRIAWIGEFIEAAAEPRP